MENLDVDTDFGKSSHPSEVLEKYETALRKIREYAEKRNVHPMYFDNYVIYQFFREKSKDRSLLSAGAFGNCNRAELLRFIRRRKILYCSLYLTLVFLCVCVYRYDLTAPSNPFVERSSLYPNMRMWRRLTLPLIRRFPQLTEYYDESCLVKNPFFQLNDLSCQPCTGVLSVDDWSETTDSANSRIDGSQIKNVPFIFKMNRNSFHLDKLYRMFTEHYEIFKRDAYRVQSSESAITNLDELFGVFNNTDGSMDILKLAAKKSQVHNLWRCNRMLPVRFLRQTFGHPERLSKFGIALERSVLIDSPSAQSYVLPETDCRRVFVQQAMGSRFIILRPTDECRHECRTLSVRLPESFVLMYDRVYWKPISTPDPLSETISIALVGSYC